MKNLMLIAHAEVKQALSDALRNLEQVSGFTFTNIESHGALSGFDIAHSARDLVVGYTPQIRVDILLLDADVDDVLQALHAAGCGLEGCAMYQITTVERQGSI